MKKHVFKKQLYGSVIYPGLLLLLICHLFADDTQATVVSNQHHVVAKAELKEDVQFFAEASVCLVDAHVRYSFSAVADVMLTVTQALYELERPCNFLTDEPENARCVPYGLRAVSHSWEEALEECLKR